MLCPPSRTRLTRAALAVALVVGSSSAGCGWPVRTRQAEAAWLAARDCVSSASVGPRAARCEVACEAGVALACTARGRLALAAAPPDRRAAIARFDEACRMGDGAGCLEAGLMFDEGIDGVGDPAVALRFFRRACDEGAPAGCTNLGLAFHRGEVVTRDEPRAVRLYEKGCEAGDPGGCSNLAYVLHYGIGVEQDPAGARRHYDTACAARHPGACENLAALLVSHPQAGLSGGQRKTEPERAASIWKEACSRADRAVSPSSARSASPGGPRDAACINYAICLETGLGVPADPALAQTLLREACDSGHIEGCLQLAVSLEGTTPIAPEALSEARRLYKRVCRASAGAGNRDLRACKALERLEQGSPPGGLDGL
jgi:TPR repeat protein